MQMNNKTLSGGHEGMESKRANGSKQDEDKTCLKVQFTRGFMMKYTTMHKTHDGMTNSAISPFPESVPSALEDPPITIS